MDKIIIEGGIPLKGKVRISGSKNSVLPCLFATLLTEEDCRIGNVPDLEDIDTACALLKFLGKKIFRSKDEIFVSSKKILRTQAPYELVRRMRASALVLGPILARRGIASASLPGGCAIGNRPIDIHIDGFKKMGAQFTLTKGMVELKAKKLYGEKIKLKFPSVGATENLLMASVLAEGETVLENVAREPEIVDLANFLKSMGAQIQGQGTGKISVQGVNHLGGVFYRVIPDRIETCTYLIAAFATGGQVQLEDAEPAHLEAVLKALVRVGAKIETIEKMRQSYPERNKGSALFIDGSGRKIKPFPITTAPFPGFPTDVQAQWMVLMSLASGKAKITETIFENRFMHVPELCRMGAKISVQGNSTIVEGVKKLSGAHVMVSDLRAGAALVIAGLLAQGKTVIHRVYHLDRGYEKLEQKLRALGAHIKRITKK